MIKYVKGDVTNPNVEGYKILPHIVNSHGIMGSGVALGISRKWPKVKKDYIKWYNRELREPFDLGENQYVKVDENTTVVNMVGQKLGTDYLFDSAPPIRLWAVDECLHKLASVLKELKDPFTITAPKFGSLRAGGDWDKDILPLVEKHLGQFNVVIFEYEEK